MPDVFRLESGALLPDIPPSGSGPVAEDRAGDVSRQGVRSGRRTHVAGTSESLLETGSAPTHDRGPGVRAVDVLPSVRSPVEAVS